jgi:hypothetical protein
MIISIEEQFKLLKYISDDFSLDNVSREYFKFIVNIKSNIMIWNSYRNFLSFFLTLILQIFIIM